MGVKISNLPSANNSNNDDILAIVQNGETKKVEKSMLVNSVNNNIAKQYSTASTYEVGDYCIYQGQLYICLNNIASPEEWTANHWRSVTIADNLGSGSGGGESLPVGSEIDFDGSSSDIPVGWQQITNPDAYSTSEVLTTKTWIDGKPIYRKVIVHNITSNDVINISHNIQNIDMCWLSGESFYDIGGTRIPLNYYRYGTDNCIYAHVTQQNAVIKVYPTGWVNNTAYFIIEYTKTTD